MAKKELALTSKQKQQIIDAHLLDTVVKDADLIKAGYFDKKGVITALGNQKARQLASEKHAKVWK